MKNFKEILFINSFLFARIPIWFIFVAFFVNNFITIEQFFALFFGIIFFDAVFVSELTNSKITVILTSKFYRFIGVFAFVIFCYFALIYIGFVADNIDKLLISLALMILVFLYYDNGLPSAIPTYIPPIGSRVVVTLLWGYLAFIPDSIIGNLSIICAIYIIEFFFLIQTREFSSIFTDSCKEV